MAQLYAISTALRLDFFIWALGAFRSEKVLSLSPEGGFMQQKLVIVKGDLISYFFFL